jgi:quercetin dioxygenase-like cupin family protein
VSSGSVKAASKRGNGKESVGTFGSRIEFLTPLSDADDEYCLIRGAIAPGGVVPIHSHAERETFYVIEGEIEALLDDSWSTLKPNDMFDVPGGRKHGWRNVSGAPATLVVVVPMRLARFLHEAGLSSPQTVKPGAPGPAEMQRFLDLVHEYGYWVGSPEDNADVGISFG